MHSTYKGKNGQNENTITKQKQQTTGRSHTTLAGSCNSRLAVWHWHYTYPSTIPETTPRLSSVPETVQVQHMPVDRKWKWKTNSTLCIYKENDYVELPSKPTLSKPLSSNLFPRTSPIPARAITGFSPMGSATKSLCFCDVEDIVDLR